MIKNKLFVTAFIADIHFGAMKADDLYAQLKTYFLDQLKKYPIDLVVFGGDTFHNVITMNYSTSHIVLMFMENVIEICKECGIPHIRMIQGTVSHDNNQLHNFHIYEGRDDIDFKIIMNVIDEEFPEGIKVLYIPEEYMKNPEVYYEDYFDNHKKYYDLIFGHGMVEEVSFVAKDQDSENTMSGAPIFNTKKLLSICKGPVLFGHIHIGTEVRKHLYYPGSFSRWKFGEDGRKGWILNVYNVEDSTYANKYIENKAAPVYTTVKVELNDELSKNPEKIMDFIKDIHADKIMIKLSVVNQDSSYAIQYLISKFKNSDMVKLNISNTSDDSADVEEQEFLDELEEEYKFILDENLTLSQKLQKAVQLKKGRIIPITFIDEELDKKHT